MKSKLSEVRSVVVMGLGTFGAQTAKAIYAGGVAVLARAARDEPAAARLDHRAALRNGVTLNRRAFSAISRVMKRAVIGVPS